LVLHFPFPDQIQLEYPLGFSGTFDFGHHVFEKIHSGMGEEIPAFCTDFSKYRVGVLDLWMAVISSEHCAFAFGSDSPDQFLVL